jgi:hypothetical protein
MFKVAIIGLVIALAGVARAETPIPEAEADDLMRQALELRRQGQNAKALELLQRAQTLAPSAKALAQLGSAEFALQRWVDAETHLEQALSTTDSPWIKIQRNHDMLERTLADARRHIGRVQLRGTSGAQISIDGKAVGILPISAAAHVAAGVVRIAATAAGRQGFEKNLTVAGGEEATLSIDLVPVVAPLALPPAASPVLQVQRSGQATAPAWRRWTGGTLFVAGLAAVGAGIAWVVVDGRTTCNAPPGGVCELVYNTKTQGWVSIAAGAVAAGVGATLFLWKGKETSGGVAIGPGMMALHGRF